MKYLKNGIRAPIFFKLHESGTISSLRLSGKVASIKKSGKYLFIES